jgi:uncharacterized repeat protein (TIGR02543 family)
MQGGELTDARYLKGVGTTYTIKTNVKYTYPVEAYEPSKSDMSYEGFEFDGWYKDADYFYAYDFKDAKQTAPGLVLYAKWKPITHTVNVKFKAGDNTVEQEIPVGNHDTISASDLNMFEIGQKYENLGIFKGWFWEYGGVVQPYAFENEIVSDNVEIFGMWETEGFKVTYDLGDGSGTKPVDSNKYDINTSIRLPDDNEIIAPSGKEFVGWVESGETTGTKIYYPGTRMQILGNVELVAVYADPSDLVRVTYHQNEPGNMLGLITAVCNVQRLAPTKIEADTNLNFKVPGYAFIGWSLIQSDTEPDSMFKVAMDARFKDHIDLYAVWQKLYKVSYLPGGSDVSGLPAASGNVGTLFPNEKYTISSVIPTRTGYTFDGWTMTSSGSDSYVGGYVFDMPTNDVELVAAWTKVDIPVVPPIVPDVSEPPVVQPDTPIVPEPPVVQPDTPIVPTPPVVYPDTQVVPNPPIAQPDVAVAQVEPNPPVVNNDTPAPTFTAEKAINKVTGQSGNIFSDLLNGNVPLGNAQEKGAWSLLSLLMSFIAVVISVLMLVGSRDRRVNILRVLTIIAGGLTPVVWLWLDNLNQSIVWINRWTIFVGIVFAIHVALLVVYKVKKNKDENDDEDAYGYDAV